MTFAIISAVYLGLLCSVAPCPLATNIAAVSFIGRQNRKASAVFYAGLCYALGRILAFCVLGIILAQMLHTVPAVSHGLQKYMNMFLGPCMILVGMVLLELLSIPGWKGTGISGTIQHYIGKCRMLGAVLLGILFALSFCPSSAVLYFGTLISRAGEGNSLPLLSGIFGFSSCVPVLFFAFVLAFSSRKLAVIYNFVGKVELGARWITGGIFLLIGIYFTLSSVLR